MSKTIVSAFENQRAAAHVLNSAMAGGFDSYLFSVIEPTPAAKSSFDSIIRDLPGLQVRLYRKDLQMGESLLVARVDDKDVARLIRLLQATGGHHIEAFDPSNSLENRA